MSFVLGEGLALLNGTAVVGIAVALWAAVTGIALAAKGAGSRDGKPFLFFALFYGGRVRILLASVCLAAAFGLGFGRGMAERARFEQETEGIRGLSGVRSIIEGEVEGIQEKEKGLSLVLVRAQARAGRTRASFRRLSVFLEAGESPQLKIGWRVRLRGELEEAERARNPGTFDFGLYARSRGYCGQVYGEDVRILDNTSEIPYLEGIRILKKRCGEILEQVCDPRDLGVFQAVVLGEQSQMDPQLRDMYQRHGISHLLAVSGQHLTILGGSLYLLLRRMGVRQFGSGLICGLAVISYGILTGSSGSAMRAVVMILCLWLGAFLGRTYDSLSAMGLAAVVLLWQRPYMLFQSGFQLSFGAVWAIAGPGAWLCQRLGATKGWQKTLIISLSVQLVLTPMVVWHYFRHPFYGLLLNLLVMPMAAGLIYSGAGAVLLGAFGVWPGRMAAGTGHFILLIYEGFCGLFERLPGWSLLLGRPGRGQLAAYGLCMGLLAAALFWSGRLAAGKEKRNIGETGRFWRGGLLLCLGLYGAGICLLRPLPVSGLRITCLDVGQGDGIVVESPAGAVLADGGSTSQSDLGEDCLEPFLESRGIDTIRYALVSHGDQDHISGLLYLLGPDSQIQVENLVLPHLGKGRKEYEQLRILAREKGTRVLYMDEGSRIRLGEMELLCLYGGDPEGGEADVNRQSPTVKLSFGPFHMLLTGDMDAACERKLLAQVPEEELEGIQLLKTAHHGSKTSSSVEFLEAVKPLAALISYGRDNSYGHPSPEVLERFKELGVRVWETGRAGAVTVRIDQGKMEIRGFLPE